MKTTFKTVFTELDDELMNLDIQENVPVDIDIDKIKSEVLMQINAEKNTKKKFNKKFIVILAAAVILVGGTVGAFATGSIQSIFKGYFKGADVNDLGLYDGGNVEVQSDDYDVKLLGVMSDGEIAYSAMEVTRKDGGDIAADGWNISSDLSALTNNTFEFSFNGAEPSQKTGAITRSRCSVSDDRKTLNVYIDYTRGVSMEQEMKDFRVTYHNTVLDGYKIDKILYSKDLPEVQAGDDGLSDEEIVRQQYEEDLLLQKLREGNGLTEDDCVWLHHDGKLVYVKGEQKLIDLPFDISFDIDTTINNQIERDITSESTPHVVKDYASNTKITISPLGISLSGECDQKYDKQMQPWGSRCFEVPDTDGNSKVIMDDGSVYYILINEGSERRTNDSGVFHETTHLQYSATKEMAWNLGSNRIIIDLDKVQSVIINGDTLYQK